MEETLEHSKGESEMCNHMVLCKIQGEILREYLDWHRVDLITSALEVLWNRGDLHGNLWVIVSQRSSWDLEVESQGI